MRITFVLPHAGLSGGVRVCAIYADLLQRFGHQVACVSTPRRDLSWKSKARKMLTGRRWKLELRGPSHLDNVPVEHRVIESFRPIVDADLPDADVVIATWWETAEWVAGLSPNKGAKVHLIQHDETQISYHQTERVHATWRLPLQRVVVARWLADLACVRYGLRDVPIVLNGVDLGQFNAPPRGKRPVPTVGTMYSAVAFKGCDIALEAVRIARRTVPDLALRCFGIDEPGDDLPLPENSIFEHRPAQDHLRNIYAACDAWLFSSRSEGFGLPVLEAMACRTPVIGTPTGAAPDLIGEGGGILTRLEDAEAMAAAIVRIAKMEDGVWRRLSDAAVATAERFPWDSSARSLEAFLRRACSRLSRAA